jgi:peptidoglycan/LPS O-acetylase OafA/YrhL
LLTYAIGSVWPLPGQHYTIMQLLLNATMLQGFMNIESIDGVYWTLSVELCFYAVMLGLFLFGMLHNTVRLCLVWLAAAQSTYWLSTLGIDVPWKIQQVFVLRYAELFVAGIVFYEIYVGGINITRGALLILCLVVHIIEYGVANTQSALVMFALVAIAVSGRARLLCVRPLIWLGTISYTLYLTHQMIGFAIIRTLAEYKFPSALAVPTTIIIVLGIASMITYLIEQPGMRYIRAKYKRSIPAPSTFHAPVEAATDLPKPRLYEPEGRRA